MTIEQVLHASGLDAREARLLLAEAAGFSQASLIASSERQLPDQVEKSFFEFTSRRKKGEPIAYIVGHKEFYGLDLAVNPAVLIPRPETELLVDLALQGPFANIVDLGTGSGAIALAVKTHRPEARVVAVEASAAALQVAKRNSVRLGVEVEFLHGRWFEPLGGELFDVIVANPPYVAERDPHLAALGFEPQEALVAGSDGLAAIREIVTQAPAFLARGGRLLLEHGIGQENAVCALLASAGLEEIATWPDLAGIARVTGGKR